MDKTTKQERPDLSNAGAWNSTGAAVKVYKCHKFDCDFETSEPISKCPECGFHMLDPAAVRLFGVLVAILGVILGLGGAIALIFLGKTLLERGGVGFGVLGIFGALLAAGVVMMIGGTKQATTGNKSSNFIAATVAIFIVLAIIVAIVRMFL